MNNLLILLIVIAWYVYLAWTKKRSINAKMNVAKYARRVVSDVNSSQIQCKQAIQFYKYCDRWWVLPAITILAPIAFGVIIIRESLKGKRIENIDILAGQRKYDVNKIKDLNDAAYKVTIAAYPVMSFISTFIILLAATIILLIVTPFNFVSSIPKFRSLNIKTEFNKIIISIFVLKEKLFSP